MHLGELNNCESQTFYLIIFSEANMFNWYMYNVMVISQVYYSYVQTTNIKLIDTIFYALQMYIIDAVRLTTNNCNNIQQINKE